MLHVITVQNANLYRHALLDSFRLRHRILVEKLGWEAIRKPDGIERDRFDNQDAIYLMRLNDDGDVTGTVRFLPTTKPHMFTEIFSNYCDKDGVLRGADIYEGSRFCIDRTLECEELRQVQDEMMCGIVEFCVVSRIRRMTLLTSTYLMNRCVAAGVNIRPLGLPRKTDDGSTSIACVIAYDRKALSDARVRHDIQGDVLCYAGAQPFNDQAVHAIALQSRGFRPEICAMGGVQ